MSAERRFRRSLIAVVATLAVAAGMLAAVAVLRGPHAVAAGIDVARSVERAGSTLVFELDRRAVAAGAVEVSPPAAATAEVDGRRLTVTFAAPLDYARDYTVTVAEVRGSGPGGAATLSHRFRTPDHEVYTLQRGEGEDAVERRALGDTGDREHVFTAPRIQEFAILENTVVAALVNDDGTNTVVLGSADGPAPLALPGRGSVTGLRTSATGALIGYVLSETDALSETGDEGGRLVVHELSGTGDGSARFIEAYPGTPLSVADWRFVPGSGSVVVLDAEGSLFLIDVFGRTETVPLGRHSEIRGFLPGTTRLIVANPDHGALIDLTDGTTTRLELPESALAARGYPGSVELIGETAYLIEVVELYDADGRTESRSRLVRVDGTSEDVLFEPALPGSRIQRSCLSPNGYYVAVETVTRDGRPDGYPRAPGSSESSTAVVELSTGLTRVSLAGAFADWCD